MNCEAIREVLGAHLDGELPPDEVARCAAHLQACEACAAEADALRELVNGLQASVPREDSAPEDLWPAIAARMEPPAAMRQLPHWLSRPLAAAASLAFLIGGVALVGVWLNSSTQVAHATSVDYRVLLDNLPSGVDGAVQRFLRHYGAEPVSTGEAHAFAPQMRFEIPRELPLGFALVAVHRMHFGSMPGVCAEYRRGDEPLVVFFHPPVNKTVLGIHRESHCDVSGRSGQCVEVGPWRLIHFTDPTTCHCLLSKLQDPAEIEAVFAAVAPDFAQYGASR